MTYQQTLDYLFSRLPMFQRIGAAAYKSNLNNTLALSRLTGFPETHFPSVHIAGTNGKGSVSHLIASVLQEAGYKTALFTSPHLKDFRERIRINGKKIPRKFVSDFVSAYRNDFEKIQPSFFEMTFALAMSYFSHAKPDVAVIETGMGGRLDSTNIVKPVLCIITNIGFDHTRFLGDTLEKIATEKAGIIKHGIPVVIGESQPPVKDIFLTQAANCGSDIYFADESYHVERFISKIRPFPVLEMDVYKNNDLFIKNLATPLAGLYQIKNTLTVLKALEILAMKHYSISREHIKQGFRKVIRNTDLKGRWQVLKKKPLVICDTGHNTEGLKEIVRQFRFLKYNRLHIVFGMVNDKDISGMLDLLPRNAEYYFCRPDIPRGLEVKILEKTARKAGLKGKSYPSVQRALAAAEAAAEAEDMIFVGGSTFVVAEVI